MVANLSTYGCPALYSCLSWQAVALANSPFYSIALRATLDSAQASIPQAPIRARPLSQGDAGPPVIHSKGEPPAIQMQGLSDLSRAPAQVSQPPAARMVSAEEQAAAVPADNTALPPSSIAVSDTPSEAVLAFDSHNSSDGATNCGIMMKPGLAIDAGSKGASTAATAACWRHNGCR